MADLSKTQPGWFCFRALPKKEHIAAKLLEQHAGIRAFCPRMAYHKRTRRGKVRFIACLFPGYVFVNADLVTQYRLIRSIQGIRDVVAFGDRIPSVPAELLEAIRKRIHDPEGDVMEIPDPIIEPGMEVVITEGPLKDFTAVVSGEQDGRKRVALLLEFLGRSLHVRMSEDHIQIANSPRIPNPDFGE